MATWRTVYGTTTSTKKLIFLLSYYFTGDGCKRDEEGFYRMAGRVDDVLNVSGHRLGTAKIEDAINQCEEIMNLPLLDTHTTQKDKGFTPILFKGLIKNKDNLKKKVNETITRVIGPIANHIGYKLSHNSLNPFRENYEKSPTEDSR